MKLFSESLKRDIDFVTFEKADVTGRVVRIIMHDSLREVVHTNGIKYDMEIVSSDPAHSIAICRMYDEHRFVTECGESLPETLTTDIARQYPTLIAYQRAFDRAAIAFLALPGKVFSNMEIDVFDTTPVVADVSAPVVSEPVEEVADIKPAEVVSTVEDVADVIPSDNLISATIENDDLDLNIDDIISAEEVVDTDELPFDVSDDAEDDIGNYVITMNGKYQTAGLSIAEIYAHDAGWVEWIASHFTPRNEVAVNDVEAIKKFLATRK